MEPSEIAGMIDRLIDREGGYVDHPSDAGGCTNMGVTQATLARWRGAPVSCAAVRDMSRAEARSIYRAEWVDHPRLRLAEWFYRKAAEVTLDSAVMFANGRKLAAMWMQEAINEQRKVRLQEPLAVDGWAGPRTLEAMVMCDQGKLVAYAISKRVQKHARVVAGAPSQAAFIEGWINRAVRWIM